MTTIVLPNVRKLFIPDPDHMIFEGDLAGADAQVVAWEAEDEDLKAAFRAKIDVHVKNAEDMWGASFTKLQGYARDAKRQELKRGVHATNYGGTARTLATTLGWTVHEADSFQKRWFSIHPLIEKNFHGRIRNSLHSTRTVTNKFGFRRVFFDRIDNAFTEALAWVPQSTVALNTFHGAFQLEERYPVLRERDDIMLQVHDSIVFQFHKSNVPPLADMKKALEVKTPYDDPLYIPWDIKGSEKSWGDVHKL